MTLETKQEEPPSLPQYMDKPPIRWSSERMFIFATIGAAVGLGNLWRFPYLAGENGGAAFILAYLVAVLLFGIPLMILEIGAGRAERGGPIRALRKIWSKAGIFGWLVVLLTLLIMSYYFVITGWTLGYAVNSYRGSLQSFAEFTTGYASLGYFAVVFIITSIIVAVGVKAIEWLAKIMVPLLIVIVLLLTAYSLTLPGRSEALAFLFNPDFSMLTSPTLWLLAFGQAFYSLAVGQGYLITYGSFLEHDVNVPRSTGFIALFETTAALVAGVMIFPIVFSFGLDPGEGTELAFNALPLALQQMPFGGIVAILFFSLFFLAAISSCVAGMEVVKTAAREEFELSNLKATLVAFLPALPLGILSALSFTPTAVELFGRPFLEVLDLFAANQIVVISGITAGAIIGWNISKVETAQGFGFQWRRLGWWTVLVARFLPIPAAILLLVTWLL
jgi:neurotransmitter:Na+ symporter, NSS family